MTEPQTPTPTRWCVSCGKTKSIELFSFSGTRMERRHKCRECTLPHGGGKKRPFQAPLSQQRPPTRIPGDATE